MRLAPDRRTLLTSQPLASVGSVRVLANDEQFIPQGGLLSSARLLSSVAAPFDLPIGQRTLSVQTGEGQFTVNLTPRGTIRMPGQDVVQQIVKAAQTNGKTLVVSLENGHLSLQDGFTAGLSSFVRVSGSASVALGFGDAFSSPDRPRGVSGKVVFPGWQIEPLPNRIGFRTPRFLEPLRSNPELRVSYGVASRSCRRCLATQVENDVRLDASGQAIMVRNEDLLYQAALKILLTDRNSNPYHPWYGTGIRQRIGSKALGGVAAAISEDVRRALAKLQTIQTAQAEIQTVSPRERLLSVLSVRVSPHVQDPTTFLVEVEVQNASNQPVSIGIVYTAPGTVALLGSNGLSLGTSAVGLETGTFSPGGF